MATAPLWALLTFFYVRDRYDKEPRLLLVQLFVRGMLVTLLAAALSLAGIQLLSAFLPTNSWPYLLIENFVLVALVEEYLKYFVVWRGVYFHPAFNEPYDGMLYAITASLGFAALENILYVTQGGLQVAVMRALLSVPGHALFAAAMGYFIGKAKFAKTEDKTKAYLKRALIVPVLLHGIYDLLLSTQHNILAMGVVPLSIGMWVMALRQVRLAELRSPFRP
jgi:RsiW-degrading membrane proteinase PrsW (M82 family)